MPLDYQCAMWSLNPCYATAKCNVWQMTVTHRCKSCKVMLAAMPGSTHQRGIPKESPT